MNMNFNKYRQRTYNLNIERNEQPIDYKTLNNFDKNELEESQTGEKMFDILDEIDKNIQEAEQNIFETNKIQNMYNQKNIENLRRLKQNHINNNLMNNNFKEENNQRNRKFYFDNNKSKYESPMRILHSNFDKSNKIQNNNLVNNNSYIIAKNNKNIFNKLNTSNNSRYKENNKTEDYLNYQNRNNIPRGYIKRVKSATYNNFNKSKNTNMNISINTSNYEKQKKLNKFSNQEMDKLIDDIKAIKLDNKNLLIENRTLKDTFNKVKNNLENEIRAKESEIKSLKEENKKLKNIEEEKNKNEYNEKKRRSKIDINSKEFRNQDRNDIYAYLESLQDDYDKIFDDNIKLIQIKKEL